ncbi:MAG: alkaline phosphatase [Bacteroidaceae bacterium]|nr:alkaline phosphatase [Bacteroidaceae bacterium]
MKKSITLFFAMAIAISTLAIQPEKVKPVKNIILMVTDGTSISAVSTARWLKVYRSGSAANPVTLNIDPWLCGYVRTCNSDAPIGDSAPTTSCYVTGHLSRSAYIATFPPYKGKDNIEPVDSTRAYAPMATILEAGRQLQGKALGMVFTCQYCHATPADCSAHYYNRGAEQLLADQTVHNGFDVVIGGGNYYLTPQSEAYLRSNGTNVYRNDLQAMRFDRSNKMWALYGDVDMDYDIDRNPDEQPSLAEMTRTAIDKLSKDKDGFFLLVEGSKVDWAAHANDPAGLPNEFLAFDEACGVALDFAQRDGNTVVIVVPDHGNSGFSFGRRDLGDYSRKSLDTLLGPVDKFKRTADGMEALINSQPFDSLRSLFKQYEGIDLTPEEYSLIINSKDYRQSPIPEEMRKSDKTSPLYSSYLSGIITKILTRYTPFAWTTGGHTGEDVFLAVYNPHNQRPLGYTTNVQLAHYIQKLWNMHGKMDTFTDQIFARHTDVFVGYDITITKSEEQNVWPVLTVTNPRNGNTLTAYAFSNIIEVNGKQEQLPSVVTYVDRNDMFYLPRNLADKLK